MGLIESGTDQSKDIKEIYAIYSSELIPKNSLRLKKHKISREVFKQLLESFERYTQYAWSSEIENHFETYFYDSLGSLWEKDKQKFYHEMLINEEIPMKKAWSKNYEAEFYERHNKIKNEKQFDHEKVVHKIEALNYSIIDENEEDDTPFLIKKKKAENGHVSLTNYERMSQFEELSMKKKTHSSEYYDFKLERSSVIVPETVFTERLGEQEKQKINEMLDMYKVFSQSLQQLIKSVSLISCPLKHFEISLKNKVKLKKIKGMGSSPSSPSLTSSSIRRSSKQAALLRKKKEYNNTFLLVEIKDFTDAYTEFIWKYLNMYRIAETEFSEYITIETAYGIALKLVWSFTSWIGERGYDWEESQIPKGLDILLEEQKERESKMKKKPKALNINLGEEIISQGCDLSKETSPQKYLKKIVIIYRELSKKCANADELILYYEALFHEMANKNCHFRVFRMQSIIEKLLKMEDSSGEICYAWTTWNIVVETLKKIIGMEDSEKEAEIEFQKYLSEVEKSRLINTGLTVGF